jgi:ribosomal protein L37AE/L43A
MKTRILGIVMVVVSLGVAAWLVTGLVERPEGRSAAGYVLGLCLFSLPFFAVGLYLLLVSRGEVKAESRADTQRIILNSVMTRGRVSVADLAIECNLTRDQVKQNIYDLIGKDLFRGYVNWERGELVSAEAAQIKEDTCPNCGGKVELAGKGLVRCPYCGTETYLSAADAYVVPTPAPTPMATSAGPGGVSPPDLGPPTNPA